MVKFHTAFLEAREWYASTTPLRRDLETRLQRLRTEGPARSKPEQTFTPAEWCPEEFTSDPTKPLPLPRAPAVNPRAYHVEPLTKPRPYYARTRLTGPDMEPPLDGRMTMVTESIPYAARIKTGVLQVHVKR